MGSIDGNLTEASREPLAKPPSTPYNYFSEVLLKNHGKKVIRFRGSKTLANDSNKPPVFCDHFQLAVNEASLVRSLARQPHHSCCLASPTPSSFPFQKRTERKWNAAFPTVQLTLVPVSVALDCVARLCQIPTEMEITVRLGSARTPKKRYRSLFEAPARINLQELALDQQPGVPRACQAVLAPGTWINMELTWLTPEACADGEVLQAKLGSVLEACGMEPLVSSKPPPNQPTHTRIVPTISPP